MYKVKVTVCESDKGFYRQIPNGITTIGEYQFFVNENIDEADFWVVCYQTIPNDSESCKIAGQNTIFVTWEPDSVWHFSTGFLNQFGTVISCQKHLRHKNLIHDQPGLSWRLGMTIKNGLNIYTKSYEDLLDTPKKEKLISLISSSKAFTRGHRQRVIFTRRLKEHFGDKLDIYGRGIRDFDDKWEAIAPYRYHICLENCSQKDYWSEKLADVFLANSFPFYYGCTNLCDYFNEKSFCKIDINDIEGSIMAIENAINNDFANNRKEYIQDSKRLVLTDYNFFNMIIKYISKMDASLPKKTITLKSDSTFKDLKKQLIRLNKYIYSLLASIEEYIKKS